MIYLQKAHRHDTDDAAEQTTYNKKYECVHIELLFCQQVLGCSPNEMNCFSTGRSKNSMLVKITQTFQAARNTVGFSALFLLRV